MVSEFHDDLSKICIVLPNRRSGLFLRKYLATETGKATWAPAIFSIEDFVTEVSGLQEVENTHLLFELYGIYREMEGEKAQAFSEFIRWAPQLLTDFNEIDRYMADPEALFSYLTEAKAIALWNLEGQPLTDFERRYLDFFKSLQTYYVKLRDRLIGKRQGWQGLIFRHAAGIMAGETATLPWEHVVFAGFNALTTSEELIIKTLQKDGRATVLLDADHYYLDNPQQEAGDFLRRQLKQWPGKEPRWISDDFRNTGKEINLIGSPDPLGQVKYCGQILGRLVEKGEADERTAVVLLEEGMLIPLLNSIPDNAEALNITAGLPLTQTPMADLFDALFNLHFNRNRFTRLASLPDYKFYYRDVVRLMQHPFILRVADHRGAGQSLEEVRQRISQGNQVFTGAADAVPGKPDLFAGDLSFLYRLMQPWASPADVLSCLRSAVEMILDIPMDPVEPEYLFVCAKIISQLSNLTEQYPGYVDLQSIREIFVQLMHSTSLPFYGEPLHGIQVMGMLETRTLDFKNVIMLSCNEDLLPCSKVSTSFIPFDIKLNFGLPTYRHKDSVYAYHFYRLLQRASNVWILYGTEADQLGGGDKSRFLRQITGELPTFNPGIRIREAILTTPPVTQPFFPPITVEKSGQVAERLLEKARSGLSASSLNYFRNCALKFYFSEIEGLKEPEEVTETIDPATLGSAIHHALHRLYKPLLSQRLEPASFNALDEQVDAELSRAFDKVTRGAVITHGKNLLLVNVARLIIRKLIRFERENLQNKAGHKADKEVVMLEKYLETSFRMQTGNGELTVKLKGLIDRVDKTDGYWQIIDYKTGYSEKANVVIKSWDDLLHEPALDIGFQLLMYVYLLQSHIAEAKNIRAGVFPLRRIGSGLLQLQWPTGENDDRTGPQDPEPRQQFGQVLQRLLEEMFDLSAPFSQTADPEICRRCPYINLCGR